MLLVFISLVGVLKPLMDKASKQFITNELEELAMFDFTQLSKSTDDLNGPKKKPFC